MAARGCGAEFCPLVLCLWGQGWGQGWLRGVGGATSRTKPAVHSLPREQLAVFPDEK